MQVKALFCFLAMLTCVVDLMIVTRDRCGYSLAMREFLKSHHLNYKDINVSREGKSIIYKKKLQGHTYPMVFLKGEFIGGYDDGHINPKLLSYIKNLKESKNRQI